MALVAVPPFRLWDSQVFGDGYTAMLIDAAGEKAAWVVPIRKTGTIDRVCFRTGTVTVGETVDVRVETLDASMNPSDTLWGATTNAAQLILATDDNLWFEVTLAAGASVVASDIIAIVIAMPGVTSGNLNIVRVNSAVSGLPFVDLYTGSWAKGGAPAIGALRYSDATYANIPGLAPFSTLASTVYANSATPDERGNKITIPFACKVNGAWIRHATSGVGDATIKLYSSGDALLASKAVDGDLLSYAGGALGLFNIPFDTEVTLAAGDVVRVTQLPTTATTAGLVDGTCPAGLEAALPSGGKAMLTTRTDAGAWTDTTTREAAIGLIVSAVDDGTGAGGGGVGPGRGMPRGMVA